MRIAISGTANTGKSTLIEDFLKRWKSFKTTDGSYRDLLEADKHSSKTNIETQEKILNWFVDEQSKFTDTDNVIFDRCSLDCLVYTLWAVHKGLIEPSFADKIIPIVRESLRFIDIIFIIPHDPRIPIEDNGVRDTDEDFIQEINAIFRMLYDDYVRGDEDSFIVFPKDDSPAVIELYGSREQRIAEIAEYVDPFGEVVDTPPEESILSGDQIDQMEQLVKLQGDIALQEKWGVR